MANMTYNLVKNFSGPVPRYTSYPTAPHFQQEFGAQTYAQWLGALSAAEPVSLYLHIPFCDQLCWYCGCTTKMVKRYEPVGAYVESLLKEIEIVSETAGTSLPVSHAHFGGGSPSILRPHDIGRIGEALANAFEVRLGAEIAVEIDPRFIDDERITAFSKAGVTRVSFGVQDFDTRVQDAINRHQTFEETARSVHTFRQAGVQSINIDLVYGLPYQTTKSIKQTIDRVLELEPDRVALFGYAHLPARLPHQRLIDDASLPDSQERYEQSSLAARLFLEAGYVRVGLDHFARPGDKLADGRIKRNFQGYTSDGADVLIGLGASAIGNLPQGYVQNAVPTATYQRLIESGTLATARGIALSDDDKARRFVINSLMCDLQVSRQDLHARFEQQAPGLIAEAEALAQSDDDGLFASTADGFEVSEKGRPFVRSICARFDAYLNSGAATYSAGV